MKKHITYALLLFVLIACATFLQPSISYAQSISLSLTPPLIELTIKPGKSVVIAYTLTNTGDPTILTSFVRPFAPSGIYGELAIAHEFSGPVRFNLENSAIQLDTPFFLKTGASQQLLLKIRVPEGTPEGDYYYSFLSQNIPGKLAEGTSQPTAQGAIGANILVSVTGTGVFHSSALIQQFTVDAPYVFNLFGKKVLLFESSDSIPVKLVAANKDTNLIKPSGTIVLKGSYADAAEFAIVPENILSNSSRLLHATPSGELKDNHTTVLIGGFHIGKLVLSTNVMFGNKNEIARASITLYALPFKLIAATFIAMIVGIIIVKKFTSQEAAEIDEDTLD